MDIRKLQYFLAVAEEGQITKAAKRLHMAQPPLSQQLKQLEIELGIQLIERNGNHKIRLTDAGQALRNRAEQILALVDQTIKELKDSPEGLQGTLTVGIVPAWDTIFLPDRIRRFRELFPEIKVEFQGGGSHKIEELLTNGMIEIAVTQFPADLETYAAMSLPDEPFVAASDPKPGHDVPANYVRLSDLAGKPLIVHHGHEETLRQYYRQIGLEPTIRCRHNDVRSMLAWAATGLGIAIVPKSAANLIPDNNLKFEELIEPPIRTTPKAIVWLRNLHLSAAARHFIDTFAARQLNK